MAPTVTGSAVAVELVAACFRTADPGRLAAFWSAQLRWPVAVHRSGHAAVVPTDETPFEIRFYADRGRKQERNSMHFDLTSRSPADQDDIVARAVAGGASHADVGQTPDEPHVVLADPDGNEFCVIEPGNRFLSDGSAAVGHFWSAVLGWPLVWDQDGETAIRSPVGGPKITWGDPPEVARTSADRFFFLVRTVAPRELEPAVQHLQGLGASLVEPAGTGPDVVELADPDGHRFRLAPVGPREAGPT